MGLGMSVSVLSFRVAGSCLFTVLGLSCRLSRWTIRYGATGYFRVTIMVALLWLYLHGVEAS